MEQLPGADTIFLAMETATAPTHTGGLTVLDPSDARDFCFEHFREVVAERVASTPRFRWKLDEVALGLDRPYWIADPDFDVARHVHRIAVPAPGGMREVCELVGHLFAGPLHRDRPLWEIWWIEGLENGRAAMFAKIHHALMDGVSGAGLADLLCDLEPDAAPRAAPRNVPAPQAPSDLRKALGALTHLFERPAMLARLGGMGVREAFLQLRSSADPASPSFFAVPRVSFNAPIGPRRGLACATVPLDDVKAVKKDFGVTVNDVLLALVGSALRHWLEERDELPDESLVALVPVSTRSDGDLTLGNQVTNVSVRWATDEPEPVERLLQVHRNAVHAKARVAASSLNPLEALGETFAPLGAGLMMRAWVASSQLVAPLCNAVVSTVRGTPVPLYTGGARIECIYPMSLLLPGQGLNVTAVSYMDHVDFGFTYDPDLVPEAWRIAEGIPGALAELKGPRSEAAQVEVHPGTKARRTRPKEVSAA